MNFIKLYIYIYIYIVCLFLLKKKTNQHMDVTIYHSALTVV